MAEKMVREQDTPENRSSLGASYYSIAYILYQKGDLDKVLELHQKSLEIREQLAQEQNTLENWSDLGTSYNSIAAILREKVDLDKALELYQKGLEIYTQLAQEQNTPESRRDLGYSYNNIAVILKEKGNWDGALELLRKNLVVHPARNQTPFQTGFVPGGVVVLDGRQPARVLRLARRKSISGLKSNFSPDAPLDIAEQLAQEQNTPENQSNLGTSYNNLASILYQKGDLDKALELHQKSLEIYAQLAQELNTPENRSRLGISYHNIAHIFREKGDLDEAFWSCRKGLKIFEQLVQNFDFAKNKEWYQTCKEFCQELDKCRKSHRTHKRRK